MTKIFSSKVGAPIIYECGESQLSMENSQLRPLVFTSVSHTLDPVPRLREIRLVDENEARLPHRGLGVKRYQVELLLVT